MFLKLYLWTFRAYFALWMGAVCLFGAPHTATIYGVVTDPSSRVVDGALVTIHQIAGWAVLNTNSDKSGHFTIDDIAPGDYLIDAKASGLVSNRREALQLTAGETKEVSIHLVVSALQTQVSVTAANAPQAVDGVSKALDVVNTADAEKRGLFPVADAVRFLPGLTVSAKGGPGAYTEIHTRGLRAADTAILIDGFRFRDPTAIQGDASAYIGDLMLVDASRIEVLRGSGSSLYGTNSIAGTINIVTDSSGGPVHGDLDIQGGGLGLFRGVARIAQGVLRNRLTYSAGISQLSVTQGVGDAGAVRLWSGQGGINYALTPKMRISADILANTGYLQLSVSPQPTSTAPVTGVIPAIPLTPAQIRLADNNVPFDPGTATFIPSLGDPDYGRYSHFIDSLFRFEHEVNAKFSYRLTYNIVESSRNNTDGPGGPGLYQPLFNTSDRYTGRIDTAQGRMDYLWGGHQILTAGYEFEREHYLDVSTDQNPLVSERGYARTNAVQTSDAVFAQDRINFLDSRLQVLLSGRFTQAHLDQPTFVGGTSPYSNQALPLPPAAYTGDASIAYFFSNSSTKFRGHIGNSFRLPSLYERFGGYLFDGVDYAYGDPRLSPERAISGDFGIDQYMYRQRVRLSGTYFYTHLQQIIGFLSFPPGYIDPYGRTAGYYNTFGAIARGVELTADASLTRHTTLFASYTYTNARDHTSQYFTGTNVDPLQSSRISPHAVSIVATEQLGKHIDLALDFYGASDYLYPLYGFAYQFAGPRQLGLSAGYSLSLSDRVSARFYTRVSNTLDQDFYEEGFRTPARWAVGGIRLRF